MKYRILNSKQIKELLIMINEQFGAKLELDYVVLANKDNKMYIVNREVEMIIDNKNFRINSMGVYIGQKYEHEFRPSIEGSQMIEKTATKNIIELNDSEAKLFFKGHELDKESKYYGYVIIKNNGDVIGTGKQLKEVLKNYNPKTRRILAD